MVVVVVVALVVLVVVISWALFFLLAVRRDVHDLSGVTSDEIHLMRAIWGRRDKNIYGTSQNYFFRSENAL